MAILRKRRYLVLIVTLVGVLLVHSFAHHADLSPFISDVLVTLILLAVLMIVFEGRLERTVALAGTTAAIAVTWSHHVIPHEYHAMQAAVHYVLQALVLGYAVVVILGNVLAEKVVTVDEVLGAVCGYLLAGASWANIYALTELAIPGSFSMSHEFAGQLDNWHGRFAVYNYFSLVTLSTMGYGDITPVRAPATMFATLEAVFGQFYIAVLVAQLVGLRLAQALQPRDVQK